jgi:hypothetical protein
VLQCPRSSELVFVDQPIILVFIVYVAARFEVVDESLELRPEPLCNDLPRWDVVKHEDDLTDLSALPGGKDQAMVVSMGSVPCSLPQVPQTNLLMIETKPHRASRDSYIIWGLRPFFASTTLSLYPLAALAPET